MDSHPLRIPRGHKRRLVDGVVREMERQLELRAKRRLRRPSPPRKTKLPGDDIHAYRARVSITCNRIFPCYVKNQETGERRRHLRKFLCFVHIDGVRLGIVETRGAGFGNDDRYRLLMKIPHAPCPADRSARDAQRAPRSL